MDIIILFEGPYMEPLSRHMPTLTTKIGNIIADTYVHPLQGVEDIICSTSKVSQIKP